MARNPTKSAGSSGPCFKCDGIMYCNEKEYQGVISLQWQDSEGKAHYTKDGNCRGTANVELGSIPNIHIPTPTIKVTWEEVITDKTDDMQLLLDGLYSMRALAYEYAANLHPEMDQNSATFGQIVNALTNQLIALAHVKAVKSTTA